MTAFEDVDGATYAYDDNGFWRFAHCSPSEQLDFAARAESFAREQFAPAIQAVNAETALAVQNAPRNTGHAKAKALIKFADLVGRRVHEVVVKAELGHWHRNPHNDHFRELTVDALDRILGTWAQNRETDAEARANHARVSETAAAVRARLVETATFKWAWERRQEEAAARLKRAAKGEDPVEGYEYVFTSAVEDGEITNSYRLPNPNWVQDQEGLATGLTQLDQIWYDGFPLNLTPNRPYAIVYKRATGTTSWEYHGSYRIYG